ncbi:MFS transporter [Acidimangrovimonas sediminis]|uniref:MFS transporter n=1 Tax=Acidimangrovimonas sediminis TaxID=2056283 RepID=UPI000C801062|nr:MFS transporter [Acidimangrovimonas sediminis]
MQRLPVSAGIGFLALGYVLSQFYRGFLAVVAPYLTRDIGAGADSLAWASGLWFVAFALAQLPVGWALDRVGPRLTAALPLAVLGGGGAFLFAVAQGPGAITWAMILIGAGCAPVLVAAYFIYAREFPPRVFATLAGLTIGTGSLGNIAGTLPLAWAVAAIGWRAAVAVAGVVTLAVAAAIWVNVTNPAPLPHDAPKGGMGALLRQRSLWIIAPMMVAGYAPVADIRGLWVGPWLADVYHLDAGGIGWVSLVMGLAMVAGNFLYGPLDRIVGSRKWGVFWGNGLTVLCLLALGLWPAAGPGWAALGLAALGICGASYPAVMAHGRAFFPPHLVGRGVTLLTLVGIGGTGLMQVVTGWIHEGYSGGSPTAPYSAIFLFFAGFVALVLVAYAFTEDRLD